MGTTNGMDPGGGKSLLQNNALIQWSLVPGWPCLTKCHQSWTFLGPKMANLNNFWP